MDWTHDVVAMAHRFLGEVDKTQSVDIAQCLELMTQAMAHVVEEFVPFARFKKYLAILGNVHKHVKLNVLSPSAPSIRTCVICS